MSKVLFLYEHLISTVTTTEELFISLDKKYNINALFCNIKDVNKEMINNADVVVFIRPSDFISQGLSKKIKSSGRCVVSYFDDDLLNLPAVYFTSSLRKKSISKTIMNSDVVLSTSETILNKYKKICKVERIAHIDTVVSSDNFKKLENSSFDTINIVYAAAIDHVGLFDDYIKPILPRLKNEYGNRVCIRFIGVHPIIDDFNVDYKPYMSLKEYRDYMDNNHFDIGIAPIHDDDFSKCKYINKFIEYTNCGIVGVYSNLEPYSGVVVDNETGFLADNNPESWYNALKKAIDNSELRNNCIVNAREYLLNNYSEDYIIERLKNEIPELKNEDAEYETINYFFDVKIKYLFLRSLELVYLTFHFLKTEGIKATFERILCKIFGEKRIYKLLKKEEWQKGWKY